MSLFLTFAVSLVAGVFMFGLVFFLANVGISIAQNGTLWHSKNEYNPNLVLLVKDMGEHPDDYEVDHFCLTSKDVRIWIANGWAFYKDYESFSFEKAERLRIGTMSLKDRFLLWKALRKLTQTSALNFELALRRKNGLIGKRG